MSLHSAGPSTGTELYSVERASTSRLTPCLILKALKMFTSLSVAAIASSTVRVHPVAVLTKLMRRVKSGLTLMLQIPSRSMNWRLSLNLATMRGTWSGEKVSLNAGSLNSAGAPEIGPVSIVHWLDVA